MATLPKFLLDCAKDKDIDPQKFAALVAAYHVEKAHDAELDFVAAFHKMIPDLPVIDEHGTITYRDGRTGTYALNEDIQTAVGPILWRHGFSLTFVTEHPSPSTVRVTGVLTHKKGHTRTSAFESSADTTGGKSHAQGRGSIMSYGHRYTSIDLLNLVTRGVDDDGAGSAKPSTDDDAPMPDGYRAFLAALQSAAVVGTDALFEVWGAGTFDQRARVPHQVWVDLKAVAEVRDAVL